MKELKQDKSLFHQDRPKPDNGLACAITALSESVKIQTEFLRSRFDLATKHDLERMEKRIMATQAELVTDLKTAIASLKQANIDTKAVQTTVDELKVKITELELLVAAGGSITPELVDAVAEVKSLAGEVDANLPDPIVVPPPPV